MNLYVVDPEWGWWIIFYFYAAGIAAGAYFTAALIDLAGREEDRPLARLGYAIAFPLVSLCGILLIADLKQPERFWHMLFKSEIVHQALSQGWPWSGAGWSTMIHAPLFKYWSPMSVGAWALFLFGACSFLSVLGSLWDEGFLARLLRRSVLGKTLQVIGCVVGFFIAAYTGSLLTATNQPLWSDSTWIAPLFLTSASSTGIATMILLFRSRNAQAAGSIARLERADLCALALETVVFVVFLISLGGLLRPILNTFHGKIFLAGTLAFGLVLPLLVHFIPSKVAAGKGVAAAALVLVGGFFLRYGILTTPPELLAEVPKIVSSADVSKEKTPIGTAGPVLLSHLSPEDGRKPPEPGADSGNKLGEVQPRSKILNEP